MRHLSVALASLTLFALAPACGGAGPGDTGTIVERGKGGGAEQCDASKYPCGPYGYQPGATIENLSFVGRRDVNKDGAIDAKDGVTTIQLSDYFQDKNIYALAISASAEWCNPCKQEQPEVEKMFEDYNKQGGHVAVLEASIQKLDGSPSDMDTVDNWRGTFGLTFDLVADPTGVLGPYYDINAFPMNLVVRTSDMKIVDAWNGYEAGKLESVVDQILAHP